MKVAIIGTGECVRTQNIVAALQAARYEGEIIIAGSLGEIKSEGDNVVVINDEMISMIKPDFDLSELEMTFNRLPETKQHDIHIRENNAKPFYYNVPRHKKRRR